MNQRSQSCLRFIGDTYLLSPPRSCLARIRLAASPGWYASQNTCLYLSEHKLDVGPHGIIPANWPPLIPQQALLAVVNPAKHSHILK